MTRRARWLAVAAAALAATVPVSLAADGTGGPPRVVTSCVACHGSPDWFDDDGLRIVAEHRGSVHEDAGLSCHDCHGGNPDPALADDMDAAMDPAFAPAPFQAVAGRAAVPAACGRCHSDPDFMRRWVPDPRVDQEREYWTSGHGKALAAGREDVATCVDCHGTHGVLRTADPASPVRPLAVAETCASCHRDPVRMAQTVAHGGPLPTDQYVLWRRSVHAVALRDRGDLSAPTCNDCHGNHGAAPPGVGSIGFVCGQCHGREARLFRASPKRDGFAAHDELMEGLGPGGCADCHEAPEPQAELMTVAGFGECTTCHGEHGVVRPTVAMLSPLPEMACAFCHEATAPVAAAVREPAASRRRYEAAAGELLATARAEGLDGEALFDWSVDRALALPAHGLPARAAEPDTGAGESVDGEAPALQPEFARLFQKFRIGKTRVTWRDEESGEELSLDVVRCSDCHALEPLLADEPRGAEHAAEVLRRTSELTAATARAERLLLRARRGGVETRGAADAVDRAVDAEIGLQVLVHTFVGGDDSELAARHGEGMAAAEIALAAGRDALDELAWRRRGLFVSLIFVGLVAVGLLLKIRQLPAGD